MIWKHCSIGGLWLQHVPIAKYITRRLGNKSVTEVLFEQSMWAIQNVAYNMHATMWAIQNVAYNMHAWSIACVLHMQHKYKYILFKRFEYDDCKCHRHIYRNPSWSVVIPSGYSSSPSSRPSQMRWWMLLMYGILTHGCSTTQQHRCSHGPHALQKGICYFDNYILHRPW